MQPHKAFSRWFRVPAAGTISLVLSLWPGTVRRLWAAQEVDASKLPAPASVPVDFAKDVLPILEEKCLRCHGPEKPKSGFRLDNREDALKGGENGVDIVVGRSDQSPLIHYVAGLVDDMEMPPPGKGDPLTPEQIGLLRAWIDQGLDWEEPPVASRTALEVSPKFGWTTVHGNEGKFSEHWWQPSGFNGGAESFELKDRLGKDASLTLDGQAMLEDYRVALSLEKKDWGFTRFGWEQYRKYYDDTGGYFAGFQPSEFSLDEDLHLDMGRAWAELGLTLPSWPRLRFGYEYQYRDGEKSTLQWGVVNNGVDARNIYPASKAIDEEVHILSFDLDHEVAGFQVEDTFRGEFYDLMTRQNDVRNFVVGSPAPNTVDVNREGTDYFHGANALRVEKQLTDWWLASGGYLYSKLDADSTLQLDTVFPLTGSGVGYRWRTEGMTLERETHAFNATSLFSPWRYVTLSAGVLGEWSRQEGFGNANLDLVLPFFTVPYPATINSSYDRAAFDESATLRFTAIPYTTLFAEGRLQQENLGEKEEMQGGPEGFLRDTDVTGNLQDWRVGFQSSPWSRFSLGGHYRHYEKETDYDDDLDISDHGDGYPAFIRWRNVITDEIDARVVTRITSWLKTTFNYKFVTSDYDTETDSVSEAIDNDVTPGGKVDAAGYQAHILSANATVSPLPLLYLSETFSYRNTRMASFDAGNASIVPYRGDVFSVLSSANYALTQSSDLLASYSFSWADYEQNNGTDGLPLGLHYQLHGLVAGISKRLGERISTRLQYGFYLYDEDGSAGGIDYTAHAVFGTVVIRLP